MHHTQFRERVSDRSVALAASCSSVNRIVMAPETPVPPAVQELLQQHNTMFKDP